MATDANNSSVYAADGTCIANNTATETVTVRLVDAYGAVVVGHNVSLVAITNDGGVTIGSPSGVSDANGLVTFSVKSTDIHLDPDFTVFQATDTDDAVVIVDTVDVAFTAWTSAANSTVVASAGDARANGEDSDTITVTLLDAGSSPVVGHTVTLEATANGESVIIGDASGVSNGSGIVTFAVKSTAAHEDPDKTEFTATDVDHNIVVTDTDEVAFTTPATDAANSTVGSADGTCLANGLSEELITVTLLDADSIPIVGHTVTLEATANGTGVVVGDASGVSDESGQVTFNVSSTTAHEDPDKTTLTATDTDDAVAVTDTEEVEFTTPVPDAGESELAIDRATCPANGATVVTATATIRDADGFVMEGQAVALAASANGTGVTISDPDDTDSNGEVEFTLYSSTEHTGANPTTLQATATDPDPDVVVTETQDVDFYAAFEAQPSQCSVESDVSSLKADNTALVTITATVKDMFKNAIEGDTVTLTAIENVSGITITDASEITDADGQVTFTAKSSVAHPASAPTLFCVRDTSQSPDTLVGYVSVAFLAVADADMSSVSADELAPCGTNGSLITVTVKDGEGNALAGQTVSVAASANGTGVTVLPASGVTNASGVAYFTATSTTIHDTGSETEFTATVAGDVPVALTDTPSTRFYGVITASPSALAHVASLTDRRTHNKVLATTITGTPTPGAAFDVDCDGDTSWVTVPETVADSAELEVTLLRPSGPFDGRRFGAVSASITISATGYEDLVIPLKLVVNPGST